MSNIIVKGNKMSNKFIKLNGVFPDGSDHEIIFVKISDLKYIKDARDHEGSVCLFPDFFILIKETIQDLSFLQREGFILCDLASPQGVRGDGVTALVNADAIACIAAISNEDRREDRFKEGDITLSFSDGKCVVVEYSDQIIRKIKAKMNVISEDPIRLPTINDVEIKRWV